MPPAILLAQVACALLLEPRVVARARHVESQLRVLERSALAAVAEGARSRAVELDGVLGAGNASEAALEKVVGASRKWLLTEAAAHILNVKASNATQRPAPPLRPGVAALTQQNGELAASTGWWNLRIALKDTQDFRAGAAKPAAAKPAAADDFQSAVDAELTRLAAPAGVSAAAAAATAAHAAAAEDLRATKLALLARLLRERAQLPLATQRAVLRRPSFAGFAPAQRLLTASPAGGGSLYAELQRVEPAAADFEASVHHDRGQNSASRHVGVVGSAARGSLFRGAAGR